MDYSHIYLGKIVTMTTGSKDVNEGNTNGIFPFFTCSRNHTYSNSYSFDDEALLISGNGDVGNVKYYKGKFEAYQRTYVLTNSVLDFKYLYYYLENGLVKHLSSEQSGTTIQFIKLGQLKNFPIVFPYQLEHQKKIAEILTKIDEAIENTEQLIQKYEQVKVGLIQDLLTKGIDENGNIRSEETHQFKDSPLGRIPVEWNCDTLGSIYKMKSGITPSRAEKSYFDDNGTNWVKTLDLNENRLFSTEEKISKKAIKFTSISVLPIDSILIAMYGGWEQIGRTSILGVPSATNQAITALFDPNIQLESEYTMFALQMNRWRWKQFAVSTRKDPNITKKDISNFTIAFPISEKEQLNIISKIDSVNKYIANKKSNLYKLLNQKQGLMQDLLSGKVRVNY
ncbi:restriction endonuclease subunit S [Myroides odoratimimus]|uniref:restriction endonuclease subunit S n=2 Tax=Myroides odoratimimus TaxID=76832 RepID=UPI002DC056B0|nr:restriction endonuclease subunit S [Myroides odoratimimus]MEC4006001.1 restriction endonuclease subunit S [Myroides odoratimimus]